MSAIARVGIDICGGVIIGNLAPTVLVNGSPIAVVGAAIASHGLPPHASAVMTTGSNSVFAHGIKVCRVGDAGSCGDTISTGSPNTNAGD